MKKMQKRKVDLATTTITTTYAGEFAGEYIAASLLSGDTLGRGLITVKPNIAFRETLKIADIADLIADASCDFTDAGTVDLTERVLEPKRLQVNTQLCKQDFITDWEAQSMGFGLNENMPPLFSDFLIAHIAAMVSEQTEIDIWQGTGGAGNFNGFIPALSADATVIDVTGVAGGITPANVIDEIARVIAAVPDTIYRKPDFGIYISNSVARAYQTALATLGYMREFTINEKPMDYLGTPLWAVDGMTPNFMVGARQSNLYFGTGLMSDLNELKIIDMGDILGDQNVRYIMRYSASTQYALGAEVVLYTPTP